MSRRRAGLLGVVLLVALLWWWWPQQTAAPPVASVASPAPTPAPLEIPASVPEPAPDAPILADVECEVIGEVLLPTILELDPDADAELGWVSVTFDDGWLRFRPRNAMGLGWLHTSGRDAVPLAWAEGACLSTVELSALPEPALVRGVLVGALDLHPLVVARCANHPVAQIGDDGRFELEIPVPEEGADCPIGAHEVVDTLDRVAPDVVLALRSGRTYDIRLDLPPPSPIGWALREEEGDVIVGDVAPHGAAARAGLRPADRVIAVGGRSADDLDLQDLVSAALPVTVTVEGSDGAHTVDLEP